LTKIATEQTKGDVYGLGFPLLEQYHEGAFFMGMGGYVFKYENGKFDTDDIGLNNEASVEAAEFLRDMYSEEDAAPARGGDRPREYARRASRA
jgi:arabinogalactan oligomer/maltooligosaccharide transport system substrate-binding protein